MTREVKTVYRVVKPHSGSEGDVLVVRRGERLAFERRVTEWPGWIWCVSRSGAAAWTPEAWVKLEGPTCVMERDYDAAELSVQPGELFTATLTESGWAWGVSSDGCTGWVPLACIETVEHG